MSKLSRTLALLAPLVLAMPMAAQAAATPVSFEGLTNGSGQPLGSGASLATAYANLGLTITGGVLEEKDNIGASNRTGTSIGQFAAYASSATSSPELTLTIDPTVAGAQFNELSFMYAASSDMTMLVYTRPAAASGGISTFASLPTLTQQFASSSGSYVWNISNLFSVGNARNTNLVDLVIESVVFRTDPGTAGLYVDNLNLSLFGTLPASGGGGTGVPEPGTFALAGLALLGAGAAARRRRLAQG